MADEPLQKLTAEELATWTPMVRAVRQIETVLDPYTTINALLRRLIGGQLRSGAERHTLIRKRAASLKSSLPDGQWIIRLKMTSGALVSWLFCWTRKLGQLTCRRMAHDGSPDVEILSTTEHGLSEMDDVVFRLVKQMAEFADRLDKAFVPQ